MWDNHKETETDWCMRLRIKNELNDLTVAGKDKTFDEGLEREAKELLYKLVALHHVKRQLSPPVRSLNQAEVVGK